jgi:HSP90 family molecular chaperone
VVLWNRLAKNLYNSRARFVFELLQNADDNHYTKARANGDVPFLSFQVYPRRIVLECNEDGFTKENLVAICDVGKSSKTGAQGYIGEKGIGFKSVFMVAWKAYIQSGDFSFSFQHKNGDSGMGMISPIWESGERLAGPLTRITLFLHETGDNDVLSGQFRELQDTILLFMKNIKRIDITMYDESDLITSRISFSMEEANDRVSLTKRIVQNGQVQEHMGYYHITKHTAEHLAKNENRKYSEAEEATRAYAKAEIILAFPLAHNSLPIIEPQDVFAFLPIRHMGFKVSDLF